MMRPVGLVWISAIVGMIGAIAAIASVPPAYIAIRGKRGKAAPVPRPPDAPRAGSYDVFISYAETDAAKATELAEQLRAEGVTVFLAAWLAEGLIVTLEKEEAVLGSANGVLVFSRATMANSAIREEYAVLLERVHQGPGRFIPVLIEDVELPPFARIRKPSDLTNSNAADYADRIARLARAVRQKPAGTNQESGRA